MIQEKSSEIRFKDNLYGRNDQLIELLEAYETSVSDNGGLALIKGVSGVGKSSFVSNFAKQIETPETYFVQGKLDLSRNNPPYATILQALGELIERWLAEEDAKKNVVISILKTEIGSHNKIILRTFPRLALLFGLENKSERALPITFKDRFNEALLSFINAISCLNQRVVFFLDDLQWADQSTLEFFKLYLSEGKGKNLFWIGAFRNDEVMHNSWLVNPGNGTDSEINSLKTFELTGLSLLVIKEMVSDMIEMKQDRLLEFSELILQLTGGNPLFIKESLPFLLEDNVLFYEAEKWDYDASRIRNFDKSSRTLEFIIKKMESLEEKTKELLGIGASIGSRFNVAILSAVTEESYSDIVEWLNPAVERRMIEPLSKISDTVGQAEYRFVHDKMQSSAYSMLTDDKKEWVHFALGKTYASSLGYAAQDRNIYNIVNQFNRCNTYFDTPKERLNLVSMNLQAGKKAKLAGSFNQALQYFNLVIRSVEENDQVWSNDIVFEVYLESGEAAYLKSDFVSSVMFYESALKYSSTNLQRAKVHHNFLVMYNGVSDLDVAWESGLTALSLLGVNFPKKIGKGKVLKQLIKIKWMIRGVAPQSLLDRPDITNKEAEQILLTLMEMIAAAWGKKPEVLAFLVLKGFEIVLKNGNTPIGYFAISGYGAILGMGLGQIEKGWEYIELGGKLTEKYDDQIFHGRGLFGVHGTYSHLIQHSKINVQALDDAFDLCKGAGDYSIAAYSSIILIENMMAVGVPIDDVRNKAQSFFKFLKRTANYDYLSSHKAVDCAIEILKSGFEASEKKILNVEKRMKRVSFTHIQYTWNLYRLMTLVIFNKVEDMQSVVDEIDQEGYNALSSSEVVRDIYYSIAKAELAHYNKKTKRGIKGLNVVKKRLVKLAKINPENYSQVLALVQALIAELKLNNGAAEIHYKEAINAANKYGFIHNEAVFSERLAKFYSKEGEKKQAIQFFEKALSCYTVWGATHKVMQLEKEVQDLN
ncbi:MAG: AAA family ATPase [Crocinitomix sp.]|nr:AAA family ATPase [Crocinitomix sp.]